VTATDRSLTPVLMYHAVGPTAAAGFRDFNVPAELLREQLTAVVEAGYRPMTMGAAHQASLIGDNLSRALVVTFDDGFLDFHSHALPVLSELNVSATLFVPTAYVGDTSRWLAEDGEGDRPMLSWSALREVSSSGVECGAHSHSHVQLDRIGRDRLVQEITLPKKLLEDELGVAVASFAYPFGYERRAVRHMVRQLGYTSACAVRDVVHDGTDDAFRIPRLTVTPDLTPDQLVDRLASGRRPRDQLRAEVRSRASWGLRVLGLKKRGTAPHRLPIPSSTTS
jgi:peptidoglycan/xylan/chitin deacetylase (PgdA/CDA1 family)